MRALFIIVAIILAVILCSPCFATSGKTSKKQKIQPLEGTIYAAIGQLVAGATTRAKDAENVKVTIAPIKLIFTILF